MAQKNPEVLSLPLVFPGGSRNRIQIVQPTQEMEPGKSYLVNDLIDRMITQSDNNASDLLMANIDIKSLDQTFEDIGLKSIDYSQQEDYMTVKDYAAFFRTLYNASYLDRDMSEKALALLAHTQFNQGLAAGLPQGTAIAHKFGEKHYLINNLIQLHDCGIIYLPDHPYILCVMSRGNSLGSLENIIGQISQKTYQAITAWRDSRTTAN
jgi:beta-lactamase class A